MDSSVGAMDSGNTLNTLMINAYNATRSDFTSSTRDLFGTFGL